MGRPAGRLQGRGTDIAIKMQRDGVQGRFSTLLDNFSTMHCDVTDKLNCYVIDRNGQQSNLAIQALVVTTKQSLYADSLYSTVLCIIDERIEQLLEDHQGEEMTPFVRALCCDD